MVKWSLVFLLGCGVEVVELAPQGDVLIVGDVPRGDIARLSEDRGGMPDPKLLKYPLEGAVLPANIAPVRFAWEGKGTFELLLSSGDRSLRVYTRDNNVMIPVERWRALLEGELHVELRSLEMKGMPRRAERTFTIGPALEGTLYVVSGSDTSMASFEASSLQPSDDRARAEGARLGSRIAQVGTSELIVDDRTLPLPTGSRIAHPSWSPDGNAIVFTYWPPAMQLANDPSDEHEGSMLAQLTLDGTFRELPTMGANNARRPRSNGAQLVFEGGKLDDPDLFVVASEGGMARRLMCEGMMAKNRAPAWLTGDWLAFVSTRDPPKAQIWFASLEDVRCTAPVWWPTQDAQRDYEALYFDRE